MVLTVWRRLPANLERLVSEVLPHAGMPLTKWVSNSKLVTSMFQNKIDQAHRDEATSVRPTVV